MTQDAPKSDGTIETLLDIMARLRDPAGGCPWDKAQGFATIAPYTIEEAYEVADAIARGDMAALKDELGDLLFQVVFYAQMAREAGEFDFADVVRAISDKMVRRHPHVFAGAEIADADAQTVAWEAHKAAERAENAAEYASLLDGVARALPALMRAEKLQKRAARGGFDWDSVAPVIAKIEEEIGEIRAELAQDSGKVGDFARNRAKLGEEIGDLLFACVNLARHLGIDAETALRAGNDKFEARFRKIEALLAGDGKTPAQSDLAEMDALWDRVKREETPKK